MNAPELLALKHDLDTLRVNFSETLNRAATALIRSGESGAAGRLLVFDRIGAEHFGDLFYWFAQRVPADEPAEKPAAKRAKGTRAPKGSGEHRHKYNDRDVCGILVNGALCGAKRQRAPKGGEKPAAPSAEARTGALAFPGGGNADRHPPIGPHGEDPFAQGAFGSSSATERNRP